MRARTLQRPCPHGSEQAPWRQHRRSRTGSARGALGAKRRTQPRAKAKLSLGYLGSMETAVLRTRVEDFIRRRDLIPPGAEVTCLVSGRRGLDLSLARPSRARLRRLRAAREPRSPRGRLRGRRTVLRRALRRRGGRRPRRQHRGRLAPHPLLVRDRPPARDRPHGIGPGRDGPLPARGERRRRRGSSLRARTGSFGRCCRCGERRRRRTAAPKGSTSAPTRPTGTRSAA